MRLGVPSLWLLVGECLVVIVVNREVGGDVLRKGSK
jgi:hypothetical protein